MGYFLERFANTFAPVLMKEFKVSSFSTFFLIGIDHAKASVEVREKFSISEEKAKLIIEDYKEQVGDGMMILSTCNRTELYFFADCPRGVIDSFCKHTSGSKEAFYQYHTLKQDKEAIEHLFSVGGGLESKILGDFEIIGQIKKSFAFAKGQLAHNSFLERLVNSCIQTSKRIKNETLLSNGAASVAFATVQSIKERLGSFPDPNVLLVGTGKIGRTACENLINQTGITNITLVNRTEEKAIKLAEKFGVQHLDFEHLQDGLSKADIVIVATGADQPTVHQSDFNEKKPRLVLDLSMPRNVEESIYQNSQFEVIDVDHLSNVAEESVQKRMAEIPAAKAIITEMVDEFYAWLESRRVAPTIQAVREKMDAWKAKEMGLLQKKFPDLNPDHIETMASQLLNRIAGQFARQLRSGNDINSDLKTIHHIFELEN